MTVQYYAYNRSSRTGKLVQVLVTKEPGKVSSMVETGVIYKSDRAAMADTGRLNREMAAEHGRNPGR